MRVVCGMLGVVLFLFCVVAAVCLCPVCILLQIIMLCFMLLEVWNYICGGFKR